MKIYLCSQCDWLIDASREAIWISRWNFINTGEPLIPIPFQKIKVLSRNQWLPLSE